MGTLSAKAQGLGAVITTLGKLLATDQRLYIHRGDRKINGILKVGKKNLFIRDSSSGKMNEIEPLCVLDFYVHESVQVVLNSRIHSARFEMTVPIRSEVALGEKSSST